MSWKVEINVENINILKIMKELIIHFIVLYP